MNTKKIICIADSHGQSFHHLIPECDILIHAGDILPDGGWQTTYAETKLIEELKKCPAKNIVFVAGNHCHYFENIFKTGREKRFRDLLPKNVHYLRDSGVTIDGLSFWGTPWVVNLSRWAFSKASPNDDGAIDPRYDESNDLRRIYSDIPENLDFLISHGPAYGFCDQILEYNLKDHLGCKPLTEAILQKKPKYVISGHIHSANHNGETIKHSLDGLSKTELYCASILDERYEIKYSPKVFEIKK